MTRLELQCLDIMQTEGRAQLTVQYSGQLGSSKQIVKHGVIRMRFLLVRVEGDSLLSCHWTVYSQRLLLQMLVPLHLGSLCQVVGKQPTDRCKKRSLISCDAH